MDLRDNSSPQDLIKCCICSIEDNEIEKACLDLFFNFISDLFIVYELEP